VSTEDDREPAPVVGPGSGRVWAPPGRRSILLRIVLAAFCLAVLILTGWIGLRGRLRDTSTSRGDDAKPPRVSRQH
jgi:hypothetical protein